MDCVQRHPLLMVDPPVGLVRTTLCVLLCHENIHYCSVEFAPDLTDQVRIKVPVSSFTFNTVRSLTGTPLPLGNGARPGVVSLGCTKANFPARSSVGGGPSATGTETSLALTTCYDVRQHAGAPIDGIGVVADIRRP
ncbi:hypothetical protein CRENBAI_004984 [Crenichthys baileyi]|uniref:Uncharacterized protein n=1 Tax=Crenichthys baileyi TaxID=28760 RepID=A0AAV9SSN1_9TELE